ncbi:hypothetical protein DEJ36_12835 [Curtobacterium sp. MCPF17_052]|nr:hypothetical protein [Curtobacterium sp. MCPF17_052]WIB11771.1 hypothetical protein DEJ36_12835 [Curtobacterium sp. MCPF17_052]
MSRTVVPASRPRSASAGRRRLLATALAIAGLVGSLVLDAPVAQAASYPSWDDVLAARGKESAKQSQIVEIRGIIASLSEEADAAKAEADRLGAAFEAAQRKALRAAEKEQALRDDAEEHAEIADASAAQAGRFAAQMARSGGGDVTTSVITGGRRHPRPALRPRSTEQAVRAGRTRRDRGHHRRIRRPLPHRPGRPGSRRAEGPRPGRAGPDGRSAGRIRPCPGRLRRARGQQVPARGAAHLADVGPRHDRGPVREGRADPQGRGRAQAQGARGRAGPPAACPAGGGCRGCGEPGRRWQRWQRRSVRRWRRGGTGLRLRVRLGPPGRWLDHQRLRRPREPVHGCGRHARRPRPGQRLLHRDRRRLRRHRRVRRPVRRLRQLRPHRPRRRRQDGLRPHRRRRVPGRPPGSGWALVP